MKKFLFLLIILIGLSQQGFAQFNLKHGRVYRELMSTIPSWISPRTAVEDNDSISLRQLGPDSFHANYSNMRLTPNYGNNVVLIKLKVDSIDGDIWFMQLDSRSNLIGWRRLYHYPTHNHWFRIWTPEDTSFFYARVINRSSISQGTRVYQTQDVVIRLYPDTINQGYPEILSKWVKGIGAIGPKGGSFFHMTYFGLLGGYDSIATYPLCVKNPLNPNDFLYVNPMFNTCFIRVSGLDKPVGMQGMLYPNPTSSRFKLKGYKEEEGLTLRLFNNSGKEVWRGVPSPEGEVDISQLSPGLYHVEALTTSGKRWSTRVVRE